MPGDRRFAPSSISAARGSVWVTTARGWIAHIDARSGRVTAIVRAPFDVTGEVVAGPRWAWIAESVLGVGRVNATMPHVRVRPIRSRRDGRIAVDQLAVGDGRVWIYGEVAVHRSRASGVSSVLTNQARLITLDQRNGRPTHQLQFPAGPYSIAFGNDALFAADFRSGHLFRIDAMYRVHALRSVRGPGTLVAVTPRAIWATTRAGVLRRIAVPPS